MLLRPSITPAPITCPILVVASNSGKPNPSRPSSGIDGPRPLTAIAYLPITILSKLQIIIINAIFIDQILYMNNVLSFKLFISDFR